VIDKGEENDCTLHRRGRSGRRKPPRLRERVSHTTNKELADAGAKHIAGGFDNAVSLVGIPPKNRYVVIQFDSMDALQKWWQGPAGAFVRECLKKYGNAGWRLIAANGVQE
jgi:uncharacterized protein (DUF1330 family)